MKTNSKKRILSIILSIAVVFSALSAAIAFSASAADSLSGLDNFSNALNSDGTLKNGMDGKLYTADEGNWKDGTEVKSVEFKFTADEIKGSAEQYVGLVYYYNNESDYKMLKIRQTSGGKTYYHFVKPNAEGKLVAEGKTSVSAKIGDTASTSILEAGVILNDTVGTEAGVKVTIDYLDSQNVQFTIVNGDVTKTVTITSESFDFKDPAKQKFYFAANGTANISTFSVQNIAVNFKESFDIPAETKQITDNSENEFGHFSDAVSADGSVKTLSAPFAINSALLTNAGDKVLSSAEFNFSGTVRSSGKPIRFIYDYTDDNNYRCLEARESSKGLLMLAFVKVVNGTGDKNVDINISSVDSTVTDQKSCESGGQDARNLAIGFTSGVTVKVEYLSSTTARFTFTNNADPELTYWTQVEANYEGANFKAVGNLVRFYLADGASSDFKFNSITYTWADKAVDLSAYAPKAYSATIQHKAYDGTQGIRFKFSLPATVPEGYRIAEFGTVNDAYTGSDYDTSALTLDKSGTVNAKKVVAEGETVDKYFYATLTGITEIRNKYIARAYVKFVNTADNTEAIVYSSNDTSEASSAVSVSNGCMVRSVISIAKAIMKTIPDTTEGYSALYADGKYTAAATAENGKAIFEFIYKNTKAE